MSQRMLNVVNGMTGEEWRLRVAEGSTPSVVTGGIGLKDYSLARVSDRRVLAEDADVTREVQDGDRLFAFAPMVVGGGS